MPRALNAGWELTGWHPLLPRLGGYTPTALFPGWCWLSTDRQPASQAPVSSNIHSKVPVTLQSPGGGEGRTGWNWSHPPTMSALPWAPLPTPPPESSTLPPTTGKSSMTWALLPGNRSSSGQVSRRWKQNTISTGQSTRGQLGSHERAHTTLPFEAPPRKDFFLVSKITTSDYKRIRVDGEATAFSLQDASPGPSWAHFSIRDLGLCDSMPIPALTQEPCSLGHHLQGCCRPQARPIKFCLGLLSRDHAGSGEPASWCPGHWDAVDLSVATLTPNKLKMIKTKSLDKDGGLMTYVSSGKSHTLNPGLAKYDHLARSEPLPFVHPSI